MGKHRMARVNTFIALGLMLTGCGGGSNDATPFLQAGASRVMVGRVISNQACVLPPKNTTAQADAALQNAGVVAFTRSCLAEGDAVVQTCDQLLTYVRTSEVSSLQLESAKSAGFDELNKFPTYKVPIACAN